MCLLRQQVTFRLVSGPNKCVLSNDVLASSLTVQECIRGNGGNKNINWGIPTMNFREIGNDWSE